MKQFSSPNPKLKKQISSLIKNKRILVTGGTGSFGKTIVAHLLKFNPQEIIIFSRTEDKQFSMMRQYNHNKKLIFRLGDVRDIGELRRVMRGIDYVFHAAAQKQVPHSEYNVLEAVKTNILGAQNVIDVCHESRVKKVIAISTDKAVEPVNAMGMTKALQEKLFIQANLKHENTGNVFSCVRYGNVLGSTGSVLPLFLKQIKIGEHLTLTHNDMTRFILTLDDAVDLVFSALVHATGGEIFIPSIPSHTVKDLAEVLMEIYPEKAIETLVTGIRVGEKMHETLINPTESIRTVKKNEFYIILPEIKIANTEKKYKLSKRTEMFRYSSDTARKVSKKDLKEILLQSDLIKDFF